MSELTTFYVIVHREGGPLATFLLARDAKAALAEILLDQPDWRGALTVEPFTLTVAESSDAR